MKSAQQTDSISVLQLALSTLCFFGCLAIAGLLFLIADKNPPSLGQDSRDAVLTYAWVATLMAVTAALSAYFALRRINGHPVIPRGMGSLKMATVFLPAWVLLIWAGRSASGSWMSILQILCLIIPFWWFFQLGRRGLPSLSPQRAWGLAAISTTLTPALLILLEILLAGVVFLLLTFKLISAPDLAARLNEIIAGLQANPSNPEIITEAERGLVSMPGFLFLVFTVIAGLIPILEELIKPLGIWFTAGRSNPPAWGWTAGLICGAAFALVESLGVTANFSGQEWVQIVILRTGTGLLHITACALVGWGLASAWRRRDFLKLMAAFCAAVALHCAWNALSILLAVQPYASSGVHPSGREIPGQFLLYGFTGFLSAGMVAILILMNLHLRRGIAAESHSAVEPPAA